MNDLIEAVQLSAVDSELIYLYVMQLPDGETYYFHATGGDSVQFRDSASPYTVRTYEPLPILVEGIEASSDGPLPRPTLTIANVLAVFKDALNGKEYMDLLGTRVTRRTTLKKYLVGESAESNPPIEYPKDVYIIDRIQSRNILNVTFELAVPYDIEGVTFPTRQIVGGVCPWQYKGAKPSLAEHAKRGGCIWESSVTIDGTDYTIYVNRDGEYLIPDSVTVAVYSGTSSPNSFYSTTTTKTRIASNGSLSEETVTDYWQALETNGGAPSNSNGNYRRVRLYSTYVSTSNYYAYTDSDYNDYVLYSGEIWQVKQVSQAASNHFSTPAANKYWRRGDVCGKTMRDCSLRFQVDIASGQPSATDKRRLEVLPFGGFPASRQFR